MLKEIIETLTPRYDAREARAIAFFVLEEGFGVTRTEVYADKVRQFSEDERAQWQLILSKLRQGMPVQYALGNARFCGNSFCVTPATLIPRPETEELVAWALEVAQHDFPHSPLHILDGGTGSGCIAVSLALQLPQACVCAWDISAEALLVAQKNAQQLGANVCFEQHDLLSELPAEGSLQILVSNPPYVCESERAEMAPHVLEHEPHSALFVPDDDPQRFYRALSRMARHALCPGGSLLVEANQAHAEATAEFMAAHGLINVEVRRDAYERLRMVRGVQP